MRKHAQLSLANLPKATTKRVVNFRFTTPGSVAGHVLQRGHVKRQDSVDPDHPAHLLFQRSRNGPRVSLPQFRGEHFGLKLVPKALLAKPESEYPDPPYGYSKTGKRKLRVKRKQLLIQEEDGVEVTSSAATDNSGSRTSTLTDVSLVFAIGAAIHKKSHIRTGLRRRVRNALILMIQRGAYALPDSPDLSDRSEDLQGPSPMFRLAFNECDGTQLIFPDWTYIMYPQLPLYRLPLPALVYDLRRALLRVNNDALQLEHMWKRLASESQDDEAADRIYRKKPQPPHKAKVPSGRFGLAMERPRFAASSAVLSDVRQEDVLTSKEREPLSDEEILRRCELRRPQELYPPTEEDLHASEKLGPIALTMRKRMLESNAPPNHTIKPRQGPISPIRRAYNDLDARPTGASMWSRVGERDPSKYSSSSTAGSWQKVASLISSSSSPVGPTSSGGASPEIGESTSVREVTTNFLRQTRAKPIINLDEERRTFSKIRQHNWRPRNDNASRNKRE